MSHRFVKRKILSVFAFQEFCDIEQLNQRRSHYSDLLENIQQEFGITPRLDHLLSMAMETGEQFALHLRWLIVPSVGLSLEPFVVRKHRRDPNLEANFTGLNPVDKLDRLGQAYAELDGWEDVEVVGLPVDSSWDALGYNSTFGGQGLVDLGLISAQAAALDRLIAGSPFTGWRDFNDRGEQVRSWEPPDLKALIFEHLSPGLLENLRLMLENEPDPEKHAEFRPSKLNIHLPVQAGYFGGRSLATQHSTLDAPPWKVALLNAGSDPFASLALGFGTVIPFDFETVYMVSVFQRDDDRELAAVLFDFPESRHPEPPEGVRTVLRARSRPARRDGDYADSVDVLWQRPKQPRLIPDPTKTPLGYSVARLGPQDVSEILLARRPGNVQGWVPFVASAAAEGQEVRFNESRLECGFRAQPQACTYSVAAQDLFGRWSEWRSADYQVEAEPFHGPRLVSAQLDAAGKLVVDFSWDWSDRSPAFIEVKGRFSDPTSADLINQRIEFGVSETGTFDPGQGQVEPLDPQRKGAVGWGQEQDADPAEPGTRHYRLTLAGIQIPAHPQDLPVFEVQARGQATLHLVFSSSFGAGFGVTAWSQPLRVTVYNPGQPGEPVPEAPQWASLPDITGVSRTRLRWPTQPGLRYHIYTASETALLSAANLPGPDLNKPFTDRVADLRAVVNRPDLRRIFNRLTDTPLERGEYEASLPRGSRVIHAYVITAINRQECESDWPQDTMKFLLVAAPQLAIPTEPELQINLENGQVHASVWLRSGPAVARVELFRTTSEKLAEDVDLMGPRIAELIPAGGQVPPHREPLTPSWRRVYYRAVAWSARDNLRGLVEARSTASPAASVVLPPPAAPQVADLRTNEPGSSDAEVLVSWTSQAPVALTPLGPHTVVLEARDTSGAVFVRIEESLHTLPAVNSLFELSPFDPTNPKITRVGPPQDYRLYAWLPRPAGPSFRLTVKLIDPLGRLGSAHADVLQLALEHSPQLSPIGFFFEQILTPGEQGDARSQWQILSPIQQGALSQYRFSMRIDRSFPLEGGLSLVEAPVEIDLSLEQIHGPIPQVIQSIPGSQAYFVMHDFGAEPTDLTVTVILTDPLGRSVSQSASLSVVPVPDVVGMKLAEAEQKLTEKGFTPEVELVALLSGVVTVERLVPPPGSPRPVGSVVLITPTVRDPDVIDPDLGGIDRTGPIDDIDPFPPDPLGPNP